MCTYQWFGNGACTETAIKRGSGKCVTEMSSAIKVVWFMSVNTNRRHAVCEKIFGGNLGELALVAPITSRR